MPITYQYVKDQTKIISDWVKSEDGRKELRLTEQQAEAFCKDYLSHMQLLSWTADNGYYSAQLIKAQQANQAYQGPSPEIKRALSRVRGLDLAWAGELSLLLKITKPDVMSMQQVSKIQKIFQLVSANQTSSQMDAQHWATIFRSTMLSPQAKLREDKSVVTSADSVTWLHQWVRQANLIDQLTLPLDPTNPNKEVPIFNKNAPGFDLWMQDIKDALFQPAHLRHMIFSETLESGYIGVMSLSQEAKRKWFVSWVIDLVSFGGDIGEYMTKSMMKRVLAVYDGIMNHTSASAAFAYIEAQYVEIALEEIPADQPFAAEVIRWSEAEKILFARLAGQMKALTQNDYCALAQAMVEAKRNKPDALQPWINYYNTLTQHPEISSPTYVPQLLQKMTEIRDGQTFVPLTKVIEYSGHMLESLMKGYQKHLAANSPRLTSSSSSSTTAGQQASARVSTAKLIGPLNVDAISRNTELLAQILACENSSELNLDAAFNVTWPAPNAAVGAKPTATFTRMVVNTNDNTQNNNNNNRKVECLI